jgi:hypothetical protein
MERGVRSSVSGEDRDVLEFLGQRGKSLAAIAERFPGFDIRRLMRAGLAEERSYEFPETQAHVHLSPHRIRHYMLTERGAEAIGIDPSRVGGT